MGWKLKVARILGLIPIIIQALSMSCRAMVGEHANARCPMACTDTVDGFCSRGICFGHLDSQMIQRVNVSHAHQRHELLYQHVEDSWWQTLAKVPEFQLPTSLSSSILGYKFMTMSISLTCEFYGSFSTQSCLLLEFQPFSLIFHL